MILAVLGIFFFIICLLHLLSYLVIVIFIKYKKKKMIKFSLKYGKNNMIRHDESPLDKQLLHKGILENKKTKKR